ncbi:putative reverse transcriptase domain-containing protein [Tanacetum coccineum]
MGSNTKLGLFKCNRCGICHFGQCPPKCYKCGKIGHKEKDSKSRNVASGSNARSAVVCYECGERGHKSNACPKKMIDRWRLCEVKPVGYIRCNNWECGLVGIAEQRCRHRVAKRFQLFLAQVTKERSRRRKERNRRARHASDSKFPEVFPDVPCQDSPPRQVKEILEKVFIRTELFTWGAQCCSLRRRAGSFNRSAAGYHLSELERDITLLQLFGLEDEAFQTLKHKLCSAPILALPEGPENFVVYCDASHKGYGAVLMQREKWPSPESKEDREPIRVRFGNDGLPKLPEENTQCPRNEQMKEENVKAKNLGRLIKPIFEAHSDGIQCFEGRIWLPLFGGLRDLIMHESHKSKYSIQPGLACESIIFDRDSLFTSQDSWYSHARSDGEPAGYEHLLTPRDRWSNAEKNLQTLVDMLRSMT